MEGGGVVITLVINTIMFETDVVSQPEMCTEFGNPTSKNVCINYDNTVVTFQLAAKW